MSYRIQNTETGSIHESDDAEFIDGDTFIRFADITAVDREGGQGGVLIHVDYLGPVPGEEVFVEDPSTGSTIRFVTAA